MTLLLFTHACHLRISSRAMDIRNQEVSRLKLDSPNLSLEAVQALADKAAARYLKEEAMSSRSQSVAINRAESNACTGSETNPTEKNMCRSSYVPTCDRDARLALNF